MLKRRSRGRKNRRQRNEGNGSSFLFGEAFSNVNPQRPLGTVGRRVMVGLEFALEFAGMENSSKGMEISIKFQQILTLVLQCHGILA